MRQHSGTESSWSLRATETRSLDLFSAKGSASFSETLGALLLALLVVWPAAAEAAAPRGTHESASCTSTVGWACDADSYVSQLTVHIFDGPRDTGRLIGWPKANVYRYVRTSCGGNQYHHGFSWTPTSSVKDGQPHTLYAYAVDPQTGRYTLLSGSPKSLTCPTTYTLGVSKAGTGSGTVTSAPAGISCGTGTGCLAQFAGGTSVTLTAAPAAGSVFTGWAGCTSVSGSSCTVAMSASKSVTATFSPVTGSTAPRGTHESASCTSTVGWTCDPDNYTRQVTVQFYKDGAIGTGRLVGHTIAHQSRSDIAGRCGGTSAHGFTYLTPTSVKDGQPHTLYAFAYDGDTGNATLLTGSPKSLTCPTTYALGVSKAGTGSGTVTSAPAGISCGSGGSCLAQFAGGTSVTLTAAPAAGSVFTGWTRACRGISPSCTVSMTASKSVTATFTPTTLYALLSVTKAGTGTGTVTSAPAGISCGSTCSAPFASGTSATLTAAPAAGSVFASWSGACTGTSPSCTVAMSASQSVTATFTPTTTSMMLSVTKVGSGTVMSSPGGISCGSDCSEAYASNVSAALSATPASGAVFASWAGACTGTSTSCTVAMTANRAVTATFATTTTADPADVVWVEDATPDGVSQAGTWTWVPSPVVSGKSHKSLGVSGSRTYHYFEHAPSAFVITTGDVLTTYVYLEGPTAPNELMLQWKVGPSDWEHRAYWGLNAIALGTVGTASRRYVGPIPATRNGWVKLAVPASAVGLEGRSLTGMSFDLYGAGTVYWDRAGRRSISLSSFPSAFQSFWYDLFSPLSLTVPSDVMTYEKNQFQQQLNQGTPAASAWKTLTTLYRLQKGLAENALDHQCFQYGYTTQYTQNVVLAYKRRLINGMANVDAWNLEVVNAQRNQLACRVGNPVVYKNLHVTISTTSTLPQFMGGIYLGDNWRLSHERNLTYYKTDLAQGPAKNEFYKGLNTAWIGIGVDNAFETVDHFLSLASQYRQAGFDYAIPVLYLKKDCCDQNALPTLFAGATEAERNSKVWTYVNQTIGTLLDRSELPIHSIEFGNELDGGFWPGVDAGSYSGPPADFPQTKRIVKAARDATIAAYAARGLGRPWFILHVMPDIGKDVSENQNLISRFLAADADTGGVPLFDVLLFSYYPNARPGLNPVQSASRLKDLGGASGLPWGLGELGVAQDRAPGPGSTWNYFLDVSLCPSLFGVSCSNLLDVQKQTVRGTFGIFEGSPSYLGALYLAPSEHLLVDGDPILRERRLGLWVIEPLDTVLANSSLVARMTPAFEELRLASERLSKPKVASSAKACSSVTNCDVYLYGQNFYPNATVELRKVGQLETFGRYRSSQLTITKASSIRVKLSPSEALEFQAQGLTFLVINPGPPNVRTDKWSDPVTVYP